MPNDEIETSFREFTTRLFTAEEKVHRSAAALYSPEALQAILQEYCDIIADDLETQSCTIQLKLHDLKTCDFLHRLTLFQQEPPEPPHLTPEARVCRTRAIKNFTSAWEAAGGAIGEPGGGARYETSDIRRDRILRSPLSFPYGVFPKGAMWLVAANGDSPWQNFVGWQITDLSRGITAEIVQERAAKVRDPLMLRQARAFTKLGDIDPFLWTNQDNRATSPRYFFTYYGVPIRIHSGGDVIGTIKVENKGLFKPRTPRNEDQDHGKDVHRFIRQILEIPHVDDAVQLRIALDKRLATIRDSIRNKGYEPRDCSELSLVYLARDLATSTVPAGSTLQSLLTIPYWTGADAPPPAWEPASAPLVQMLFEKIGDERSFFNWIARPDAAPGDLRRPRLDGIERIFFGVNDKLATRDGENLTDDVKSAFEAVVGSAYTVEVGPAANPSAPDFLRKVTITHSHNKGHASFHVQVCPVARERTDAGRLMTYYELAQAKADSYVTALGRSNELRGELVGNSGTIHLPTDRLAARIVAFTSAFPIPIFSQEDSWKLSWAAVEIGKLIERHISYRGTHSKPVVPLTADDFYRLPISDLSFVDAIRDQHKDMKAMQSALAYHLPNYSRDLKFDERVKHTHRLKEFRSYFARVGQSHRAHYDALIAVWAFALDEMLKPPASASPASSHAAFSTLRASLSRLSASMSVLLSANQGTEASQAAPDFTEWTHQLRRQIANPNVGIYPDLKFSTPPFRLSAAKRKTGHLKEALRRLTRSLYSCPQGLGGRNEPAAPHQIADELLANLLFRRYDPFIGLSVSLYLQLRNERLSPGYIENFYAPSRAILDALRGHLEAAEERGRVTTRKPVEDFVAALTEVKRAVWSVSTRELRRLLAGSESENSADVLRFTPAGAYKRIRTLVNVATNQLAPSLLNWENTRFDGVGTRITCLFKNQVFATYEEIWNRGDPFPKGPRQGPAHDGSRQRWLCLRTKVHTGSDGYSAWQVSALMDPAAVRESYWVYSQYNLRSLSAFLGQAYRYWHDDSEQYECQAANKRSLKDLYTEGLSQAMAVLDSGRLASQANGTFPFGQYVGESALDVLVHVLSKSSRSVNGEALRSIVASVLDFTNEALAYSKQVVLPAMRGESGDPNYTSRDVSTVARHLYEEAKRLAESSTTLPPHVREDLEAERRLLDQARERPAVFMDATSRDKVENLKALIDARFTALGEQDELPEHEMSVFLEQLETVIRQIQRIQMDYLFELDDQTSAPVLRGEPDVVDRILCYILLHKDARDAYNFYFYLMSLTPVEIQVRTALADTMAEQYHGIYKFGARGSDASVIQQDRLKEIAQRLESTDREMEVQFEDYVWHSMHDASGDSGDEP